MCKLFSFQKVALLSEMRRGSCNDALIKIGDKKLMPERLSWSN